MGLPVRGFLGRGFRAIGAAAGMGKALCQAVGLVRRFKPQAVAGFGGYAAFAPVMAAWLCGVPAVIHEQNAIAGMSNRILARLACRVLLSLPDTEGFPVDKCVVTGNPVRQAVVEAGDAWHTFDGKRLLVTGGSQGARALTEIVMGALPRLKEAGVHLRLQTGQADVQRAAAACVAAGYAAECVQPFIGDMAAAYRWADIVLCRAGATSVAELAAAGMPAVLVPFPYATHDHQTFNARTLAGCGAAMMVPEKDLGHVDVVTLLLRLLEEPGTLHAMSALARGQARPHAAADVVEQLSALAQ